MSSGEESCNVIGWASDVEPNILFSCVALQMASSPFLSCFQDPFVHSSGVISLNKQKLPAHVYDQKGISKKVCASVLNRVRSYWRNSRNYSFVIL